MNTLNHTMVKIINKYLQRKGIKQSFVSEHTGITTNALNLALNGKRKLTADEYIVDCKSIFSTPSA